MLIPILNWVHEVTRGVFKGYEDMDLLFSNDLWTYSPGRSRIQDISYYFSATVILLTVNLRRVLVPLLDCIRWAAALKNIKLITTREMSILSR